VNGAAPRSTRVAPSVGLCESVQWHVCRMAAGLPLRVSGTALARHVRECRACDSFVDELGAVRRWLAACPRPSALARDPGDVAPRARRALARELMARLARDLLALGRGQEARPLADRLRDVQRLDGLGGPRWWAGEQYRPWQAAIELVVQPGPVNRDAALEGASWLDPLGLDIALAWLGCLERTGRSDLARRLADRLLCGLT